MSRFEERRCRARISVDVRHTRGARDATPRRVGERRARIVVRGMSRSLWRMFVG